MRGKISVRFDMKGEPFISSNALHFIWVQSQGGLGGGGGGGPSQLG